MKVFDFDNTIYLGESSVDFIMLMMKYNKRIIFHLPRIFITLIKYKMCLINKDKLEALINKYLKLMIVEKGTILNLVDDFWQTHENNLNPDMLKLINKEDVIITAGPNFLINGIKDKLKTKNIISTEVDLDKMEITNFNFGSAKVESYKSKYNNKEIEAFYTDLYHDKPLMDLAKKAYLVKKGKIKELK